MPLNYKRLVQFMGMTGSDADGEALVALRKANALLKEAKLAWSDVLRDPASAAPSSAAHGSPDYRTPPSKRQAGARPDAARYGAKAPRHKHDPNKGWHTDAVIGDWLDALGKRRHELSFMMFLASISEQWEDKGGLTDAQYNAVKRAYEGGRW